MEISDVSLFASLKIHDVKKFTAALKIFKKQLEELNFHEIFTSTLKTLIFHFSEGENPIFTLKKMGRKKDGIFKLCNSLYEEVHREKLEKNLDKNQRLELLKTVLTISDKTKTIISSIRQLAKYAKEIDPTVKGFLF